MFPDVLTPELQVKIKKNKATIQYFNEIEQFERLSGQSIDEIITLDQIEKFRQLYSHIRVFHACKTENIQSYYTNGILPSIAMKDVLIEQFREIFLNGDYPELSEEMLQESIKELKNADKDLCFVIDDQWIIEMCGHYLIYYSGEYLGSLVAQLPIENTQKYTLC